MDTLGITCKRNCPRCEAQLSAYWPHLRSVMQMQRHLKEDRAAALALLEGVPLEIATEWLRHHMHADCHMHADRPRGPTGHGE